MNCDIENIFSKFLDILPSEDGMEEFLISKGTLSVPDNVLHTDMLCITKGFHDYGCLRIDQLGFHANKRTYRGLGLLIFSGMFSDKSEIILKLTNPKSDIQIINIKYDKPMLNDVMPGYTSIPYAFSYWPSEIQKHPWLHTSYHESELPYFLLTDEDDCFVTQEERDKRNIIEGFGSDVGCALLAELLLNIGRAEENKERVVLECEAGYRGVASASAEAQIWIAENDDFSNDFFEKATNN